MDNIVKFLLDYYAWILAVLGIAIVTIIGFLVDSKQKSKKKEKENTVATEEVKTVEPLPEVSNENAVPVVDAKMQQVPTEIDNVIGGDGLYVENPNQSVASVQHAVGVGSQNVNVQPVNPNTNDVPTLNDQKPHFEPREVNIPTPVQQPTNNYNGVVGPRPVNAVPINEMVQPVQPMQTAGQVNNMQMGSVQGANVGPRPVTSGMVNQMPNSVNYQNPVNVSPAPSSVSPVQNVPNQVSNNMMMGGQNTMVNPVVPPVTNPVNMQAPPVNNTNVTPSAPSQVASPNVGINFVTGENQNEDMWKL